MNGRVYDPTIGRFLSPDLLIQAPYNSQSFNRYSYVFNNPLSFVDPSGYAGIHSGYQFAYDTPVEEVVVRGPSRAEIAARKAAERAQASKNEWDRFSYINQSQRGFAEGMIDVGGRLLINKQWLAGELMPNPDDFVVDFGDPIPGYGGVYAGDSYTQVGMQGARENGQGSFNNWLYGSMIAANSVGFYTSSSELSRASNGMWKGKNGKWYPNSWGGNGATGSRKIPLANAKYFKYGGVTLFAVSAGFSVKDGVSSAINKNLHGVLKAGADIGFGYTGTFGGWVGLAGGVSYFATSLALENSPTLYDHTVSPVVDTMIEARGRAESGTLTMPGVYVGPN